MPAPAQGILHKPSQRIATDLYRDVGSTGLCALSYTRSLHIHDYGVHILVRI